MTNWLVVGLALLLGILIGGGVVLVLRNRERALRNQIIAAFPFPRQALDSEGRMLFANKAFYDFARGRGRTIPELLKEEVAGDEDAVAQIDRITIKAQNGVTASLELRIPRKGELADHLFEWCLVVAYAVKERPGFVFWTMDDITSRRQVEEILREEQARFVDLLEHAPIGFYSVNEDGQFLFANQTLLEWLGYSQEEVQSGAVKLHDVMDASQPEGAAHYTPFADIGARYGEVVLKGAHGRVFHASIAQDVVFSEAGDHLKTRSVVRDLTRERAMAEALERSEERFARFFQEAPVGIVLMDATGEIIECNPAFADMMDEDAVALRRLHLNSLVHPDDSKLVDSVLASSQARERSVGPGSYTDVKLGKKNMQTSRLFASRMVDDLGETRGFIAHFVDTTEQKKLELQFAQSQKMQAVGQLAGGIAHDFNNLLTAMIGFSDLLLLRHRPGDQSFADIMQIKQNANRAANLVRQLLAFSRQQTLQPRRLSVTDTIAELAHLLRRLMGESIELEISHERDLGMVKADQGQLEQVIINLAVNARDAMQGDGALGIRTANVTLEKDLDLDGEVMPAGPYVLIEVSDSGSGIAPENIGRIFEPFFSTKGLGEGTGLGLSTVYGIIKQSDGYVLVESELGQGTKFKLFLPLVEMPDFVAEEIAAEAAVKRDLSGKGTLLLVEDEDAVRSFGARALRNKGYQVLEANSGASAIDVLAESGDEVDLIITDVVMPKLDGPSLVRHVREQSEDMKVIFISGYTEDSFRKSLGEDEQIHFLPKPFSLKELVVKVKEVLEA